MKSRTELLAEIATLTAAYNSRCDQFAQEVKTLEDDLACINPGIPVCVEVELRDEGCTRTYGYAKVGEKWRLGLYHFENFKPMSELSREEKMRAAPYLDVILQRIVEAATDKVKGLN